MSIQWIKELREKTGAGFMDCKNALIQCQNDFNKAVDFLREKGLAAALKKKDRVAAEGRVHSYIHGPGKIGVLVEINCETDFVAKTPEFQTFVNEIAMHITAANPSYLDKDCVPTEDLEKEKQIFRVQVKEMGKEGPVVDKIVEGKIKKFYEESCLLHQSYIKEPEKTVESLLKETISRLGENIVIRRFVRFQLGESVRTESRGAH